MEEHARELRVLEKPRKGHTEGEKGMREAGVWLRMS